MANLKCKLKLVQGYCQFHYHCHHHHHEIQKPIKISIKMTYNVPRYFRVFIRKQFILFHLLMHKPLNLNTKEIKSLIILKKMIISLRHNIFHCIFNKFLNIKTAQSLQEQVYCSVWHAKMNYLFIQVSVHLLFPPISLHLDFCMYDINKCTFFSKCNLPSISNDNCVFWELFSRSGLFKVW